MLVNGRLASQSIPCVACTSRVKFWQILCITRDQTSRPPPVRSSRPSRPSDLMRKTGSWPKLPYRYRGSFDANGGSHENHVHLQDASLVSTFSSLGHPLPQLNPHHPPP